MFTSERRPSSSPLVVIALVLLVSLGVMGSLVGCGGGSSETTVVTDGSTESTAVAGDVGSAGGDTLIEVVGADATKTYTMADLQAMPVTEGYGGMKSSTGRITPPVPCKGVLLEDLFAEVGGFADDVAVGIVAKDGYEMTVSVEQLRAGEFITYDMVTGDEITVEEPLEVIVAYEYDGAPVDPDGEGPLRLAIVSSSKNQVTDGHWWVKWVTGIQVKPIELEWTLTMKGLLTEEMDRPTFETGAAEGCHGRSWTDSEGAVWTGIPLYLLVGRVDDENVHEGPAYNRDLADAGYQVRLTATDGKTVEISSETMYYNKDLIVAYRLDGQPLPEEYWPLRVVGEGLSEADMIGQIVEFEALLPAQ